MLSSFQAQSKAVSFCLFLSVFGASIVVSQDVEPLAIDNVALKLIDDVEVAVLEPGIIESLHVKPGDKVQRGDVLMRLDSRLYQAEAEAAELEVLVARQEFRNDVNLRFSQKSASVNEKQLQKSLEAVKQYANSITETELDRLRLELEQSTLSIEQAELQQEIARLTVELREQEQLVRQVQLDRRTVKSPLTGVVIKAELQVGEAVSSGQPAYRIINLDRLRVKAVMDAKFRNLLDADTPVYFERTDADGKMKQYTGRVSFVDPTVYPQEQGFDFWVDLENPNQELTAGLRGRLVVELPAK